MSTDMVGEGHHLTFQGPANTTLLTMATQPLSPGRNFEENSNWVNDMRAQAEGHLSGTNVRIQKPLFSTTTNKRELKDIVLLCHYFCV